MRRAALACYATGILGAISWYAQSPISLSFAAVISKAATSGQLGAGTLSVILQMLDPLRVPLALIFVLISTLSAIPFAYYCFRIGRVYQLGTMRIAGVPYVIWQLAAIPSIVAAYQFFSVNWTTIPFFETVTQLQSYIPLLWVGGILDLVFLLLFIIPFAVGLNALKAKTGISLFETVMVLAVIGVLINLFYLLAYSGMAFLVFPYVLVLQVAIILFGWALSRTH
jgi:hypothetical protein